MKISKDELKRISDRLCSLAFECHFMYDESILGSRLIGCYCDSYYAVIDRLQQVLRRDDKLLDALHCVSAELDDLLIKDKHLDDVEVADV